MDQGEMSSRSCANGEGPLSGLSVPEVITRQLKSLAQQDQQYLEACCRPLTEAQIQAIREACLQQGWQ